MSIQKYKYYLYHHIRLDKNEPFYIGVGQKYKHYTSHITEYRRAFEKLNRTKYWHNVVNKSGYDVEIMLESNDYNFILSKEKEFIELYGRKNIRLGTLVNLAEGGSRGSKGSKWSVEQKKNQSNKLKQMHQEGLIDKPYCKVVYKYNLSGELIEDYNSIKEASDNTNINKTAIAKCANGLHRRAGNYQWSFIKKDNIGLYKEPLRVTKEINQYTLDGEFVRLYNSLTEAAEYLGNVIFKDGISRALRGYNKTAYSYKWEYNTINEKDDQAKNNIK